MHLPEIMWIENSELFNHSIRGREIVPRRQCGAIDRRLIMRVYFRFTRGCVLHYARFTYVSSTAGPTLRVIMARICVTRNTMANTGERQTRRAERGWGEDAGGRAWKKKEKRKSRGLRCFVVHGATITRSAGWLIAFISREDVADAWVEMRGGGHGQVSFIMAHYESKVRCDNVVYCRSTRKRRKRFTAQKGIRCF